MKKFMFTILLSLLVLLFLGPVVSAEQGKIKVDFNSVSLMRDNTLLECNTITYNGRVYIPVEDACNIFKFNYRLDSVNNVIDILTDNGVASGSDKTKKFLPNSKQEIQVTFNPYKIRSEGIDTYIDSILYNSTTFVPVRYFAEMSNMQTYWYADSRLVVFGSGSVYSVGSVNGNMISNKDFNLIFNPEHKKLLSTGESKNTSLVNSIKDKIFDNLVSRKILKEKAALNSVTLDNSDNQSVNGSIQQIVNNYGGIASFRKILADHDTYFSQLTMYIKDDFLFSKLKEKLTSTLEIGTDKLTPYYNEHKAEFVQLEQVRAKHILIMTQDSEGNALDTAAKEEATKKAQLILSKIKAGEDFDKLMNANSQDPGLKANPNGYTFSRNMMVKEFEDAAFSQSIGAVSDLVETQYGYHIIKVEEKIPEKQKTLEEVKGEIHNIIDPTEKQAYLTKLLEQWKAESKIVNNLR